MLKKLVCRALVFLLLAVITLSAEPVEAKEKLSIWLGYAETLPVFEMVKGQFEKKYPNFEVEILTFSLRDFEAKMASSIPTGAGPHLFALHDSQIFYGRNKFPNIFGRYIRGHPATA